MGVLGGGLCLKSIMSSCVLGVLMWRLLSWHQVTKSKHEVHKGFLLQDT